MANNWFRIPVIPLIFVTSFSCSVIKENRDSCPCNLVVEITGVQDTPAALLVKSLRDSSYVELLSVSRDTMMTLYVPRGGVTLSAWAGASAPLEAFSIPSGSEAPPLYLYYGKVDAGGDLAYADIKLHKQFCTLSLEIEGPPGWGPPIGTAVRGSACGMSLSGAIIPGHFLYSPSQPAVEVGNIVQIGSIRLPRQKPDSQLMLDIVMEDNIVRTFSLGTYLQKAGYSWTAMDLEDITVHMDLSVTAVTFTTPGLSEPITMYVDI